MITTNPNLDIEVFGNDRDSCYSSFANAMFHLFHYKAYFENKNVVCEQPDLAIKKLAKLRRLVEVADLSIFFYREDIVVGAELTKNTIDTAKKLNKEFIVFKYSI